MSMALIWVIGFVALACLGTPIAVSMGLAAVLAIGISGAVPFGIIPIMMYNSMDSFLLLAVPFFALTGFLMDSGGIARRIFSFSQALVGGFRGGLGNVVINAAMIFGGISGSSVADAAALAPISVNSLEKHGYPRSYAAGLIAAAASLDVLIPPSIIAVVYAVTANVPVSAALVAGAVPGILGGIFLMTTNYLIVRRAGWGDRQPFEFRKLVHEGKTSFFAVFAPAFIIGGFALGYFTPTEASVIAVIYSAVVAIIIYGDTKVSVLPALLLKSARISASTLFLIACASLSSYILTVEQVPAMIAEFLVDVSGGNKYLLLFLVNILLLIVGIFMEGLAAVLILTPILLPAIKSVGVDPIHFGVIMIANLAVAFIHPPVGVVLYVVSSVTKVPLWDVAMACLPFLAALIFNLLLITYVPWLSLGLVHALGL
ncbi:TRAP transporter large permease [Xanthobacter sp. YC-JY1]|uniref:TRAP transporter large permease n=1 Tax=Xanthobacter sp. YC-JY1 TaxID=2419844 RepID=UPI001F2AB081|nr:TRAP transporter large permease [Xanthobacter sp. YC-JY1]UJX46305.1 TRAP transporter large permease [Xanthobacter sp. YC-JY1]